MVSTKDTRTEDDIRYEIKKLRSHIRQTKKFMDENKGLSSSYKARLEDFGISCHKENIEESERKVKQLRVELKQRRQ